MPQFTAGKEGAGRQSDIPRIDSRVQLGHARTRNRRGPLTWFRDLFRYSPLFAVGLLLATISSAYVALQAATELRIVLRQLPAPPAVSTPVEQTIMLPLAPEISPGDRPKMIGNARLLSVDDLEDAIDHDELVDGEWLCVEGRVKRFDVLWGGDRLQLDQPRLYHYYGPALDRYHILPGMNVIVRGQVNGKDYLADVSLITQRELDKANAEAREQADWEPDPAAQ